MPAPLPPGLNDEDDGTNEGVYSEDDDEDGAMLGDLAGMTEGEGEFTCSADGVFGEYAGDGENDDGEGLEVIETGDGADD